MAQKKDNQAPSSKKRETGNPYELKSDAVRRLAEADKLYIPKELKNYDPGKQYRSGVLERIPAWIKALFIKFWFGGAVCFFIYWGLGVMIPSMENMILVLAIVLGLVTDILVNNIFRFFAIVPGANDRWMMFPKKKYANLFLNIIYSFIVLIAVIGVYNLINVIINAICGTTAIVYVGVEPVGFGLFYLGVDMALIAWKNLFVRIIHDAKNKTE